ncbi:MAG TPA: NAD(P)H-hydrate dehydratase [Candidatus Enterenecus faecium]|uniref:ADP-dependent (S)-NAD(P)H-hydrate dehydratase n=1 Tax=Candidatus Enterenecus faecium TaxID=2840780 RepID=A0A9D0YTD5_9FIRM|nr:NAD(P)H-hydrate dehydratase [Candidatus Enterenecus faecium]
MREERWVTKEMVRLPRRERDSHKGDYGKLLIVAGSEGYTGAPVFASQGALRSGAGLVYLGVPRDVYPIVAARCSSAMPFPLSDDPEQLVERARSCDVVLAGPGLGRSTRAQQLMFRLMEEVEGPLVLDADGLNALEGQAQRLRARTGLTVLTPHDGEFARLAGCSLPLNDRVEQAAQLAQETGCVVVLKGHETLTVDPQGRVWRNTTGNPGMAKGGSGDILAGMIASLLGQKQLTGCVSCPGELVAWAVYLHGAAGDAAAAQYGEYGMMPDDTLAAVAGVLQTHIQAEL